MGLQNRQRLLAFFPLEDQGLPAPYLEGREETRFGH